jgi:hypothetical protein
MDFTNNGLGLLLVPFLVPYDIAMGAIWRPNPIKGGRSMDQLLLSDSLEVLNVLRAELHDSVEDSVIDQLDEVIANLEAAQSDKTDTVVRALEILVILGTLIEKVPDIASTIQYLLQMIENAPGH